MVSVRRTDAVGARARVNAPERLRLAQVFRGGFVQRNEAVDGLHTDTMSSAMSIFLGR